jgi:hypothetical protein
MYRVTIKGIGYNSLSFKFSSMEEVSIFTETVLRTSEKEIEVKIELVKEKVEEDIELLKEVDGNAETI